MINAKKLLAGQASPWTTTEPSLGRAAPYEHGTQVVHHQQAEAVVQAREWAGPAESWATIVALIVGAIWTYLLAVKTRQRFPRANVTNDIVWWREGDTILVHVTARVENVGDVMVRLRSAMSRVQRLAPLPANVRNAIDAGADPVQPSETEVLWPKISQRDRLWTYDQPEVEPRETDEFNFDFAIPGSVRAAEVYTYFRNVAKRGRELGWCATSIVVFGDSSSGRNREGM